MSTKHAVVISNRRAADHDYGWREGFAKGLERRGWRVTRADETSAPACDLLVMWGTRRQDIIKRAKAGGAEVCILERGYVADRFTWSSVSFGGGLNGRGEFRGPFDDLTRWDSLPVRITPWRPIDKRDGYALIIGQVPGDQAVKHVDLHAWYGKTMEALREEGYRDIRFRPHPQASHAWYSMDTFNGAMVVHGTLEDALSWAALVVTFNSNAGVDAVIAGRRTVAMDEGSMVWGLSQDMIQGIYPDRTAWCSRIAWCQYTLQEMQSGFCQEAVGL